MSRCKRQYGSIFFVLLGAAFLLRITWIQRGEAATQSSGGRADSLRGLSPRKELWIEYGDYTLVSTYMNHYDTPYMHAPSQSCRIYNTDRTD